MTRYIMQENAIQSHKSIQHVTQNTHNYLGWGLLYYRTCHRIKYLEQAQVAELDLTVSTQTTFLITKHRREFDYIKLIFPHSLTT